MIMEFKSFDMFMWYNSLIDLTVNFFIKTFLLFYPFHTLLDLVCSFISGFVLVFTSEAGLSFSFLHWACQAQYSKVILTTLVESFSGTEMVYARGIWSLNTWWSLWWSLGVFLEENLWKGSDSDCGAVRVLFFYLLEFSCLAMLC